MTLSKSELEAQYPEMPSIPSDIEISQNAWNYLIQQTRDYEQQL